MVKQVVRYESKDFQLFETQEECEEHERQQDRLQLVTEHFGFEFYDYHGRELVDFINKYTKGWK